MKRNAIISALLIIVSALCLFALVACGNGEHSITIGETAGGTISVDKATAKAGEEITVTVTPSNNFKYQDGSLKANDTPIEGGKFIMPDADVTITALFTGVITADVSIDDAAEIIDITSNATFYTEYASDFGTLKKEAIITDTAIVNTVSRIINGVKYDDVYTYFTDNGKYYECLEIKESEVNAANALAAVENVSKREIDKSAFDTAIKEIKEEYKMYFEPSAYEKNNDGKYIIKNDAKAVYAVKMGIGLSDADNIGVIIDSGEIKFNSSKFGFKTDVKIGVKNLGASNAAISDGLISKEVTPVTIDSFRAAIKGAGLDVQMKIDILGNSQILNLSINENTCLMQAPDDDGITRSQYIYLKNGKYVTSLDVVSDFASGWQCYEMPFDKYRESNRYADLNKVLLNSRWWINDNGVNRFNTEKSELLIADTALFYGEVLDVSALNEMSYSITNNTLKYSASNFDFTIGFRTAPITQDDIFSMTPNELMSDYNPFRPSLPDNNPGDNDAPSIEAVPETNGINLDNLHDFFANGQRSYTQTIRYTMETESDFKSSDSVSYFTRYAYFIKHQDPPSYEYIWHDGLKTFIYNENGKREIENYLQYTASNAQFVIFNNASSYFESIGDEWRVKEKMIAEYMSELGANITDKEFAMQLLNLRIRFEENSITFSTIFSTEKETLGCYVTISDIDNTTVTVPQEILNAPINDSKSN